MCVFTQCALQNQEMNLNDILIVFCWIACNATNLFNDNWRQAEAWMMFLV